MSERSKDRKPPMAEKRASGEDQPYEAPSIIWEEEWIPVTLAISCVRRPGQNSPCTAAPRL